jgi:hypothetical protein
LFIKKQMLRKRLTPTWLNALQPAAQPKLLALSPAANAKVWHVPVQFVPWQQPEGEPPLSRKDTYGFKAQIVGSDNARVVGEIELALRLRKAGYRAYWIDTFGSAPDFWRKYIAKPDQLPAWLSRIFNEIRARGGKRIGGAPDVVAWKDANEQAYFIEYKGPKDKIRIGQEAWLEIADQLGIDPNVYAIAKWDGTPAKSIIS